VQGANDTNTDKQTEKAALGNPATEATTSDRQKIAMEIEQLINEIGQTASKVRFNNRYLISTLAAASGGSTSTNINNVEFQVGSNKGDTMKIQGMTVDLRLMMEELAKNFNDVTGITGAVGTTLAWDPVDGAGKQISSNTVAHNVAFWNHTAFKVAIDKVDTQLTKVLEDRARLGSYQNRLEYTMRQLDNTSENLSASESRIRDADMAKEMMKITKANVLQQAGISMLAQANQSPQSILQLLR
jgi:flagellin